jgi:hypothetical protein
MLLYNPATPSALIRRQLAGFNGCVGFGTLPPLSASLLNYLDSVADILQWATQQTHTRASAGVTNLWAADRQTGAPPKQGRMNSRLKLTDFKIHL